MDFINSTRIFLNHAPIDDSVQYFVPYLFSIDEIAISDNTCFLAEEGFVYPPQKNLNLRDIAN